MATTDSKPDVAVEPIDSAGGSPGYQVGDWDFFHAERLALAPMYVTSHPNPDRRIHVTTDLVVSTPEARQLIAMLEKAVELAVEFDAVPAS